MQILLLYTELADYTIACLKALKKAGPDNRIMVIHFPVNPEAPFRFDFEDIGEFICIDRFTRYGQLHEKTTTFQPDKIVCCGWVNKWYIRLCREYRNKATCILTLDNHWNGNWKQQLLRLASLLTLKQVFRKVWVPGRPQTEYAKKIGFQENNIITGFYSCDLERFNSLYKDNREQKVQHFPHRFLCVARYIPFKNYRLLWDAFIKWKATTNNDWELWCAGTGEQFDQRVQHPAIRHLGFVQKNEWSEVIRQTGIFVLPSLFEPWGVVVHEFAASGYPLLISTRVGAGTKFLTEENGTVFDPDNVEELITQLQAISKLPDHQLVGMGHASHRLGQQLSPATWVADLLQA